MSTKVKKSKSMGVSKKPDGSGQQKRKQPDVDHEKAWAYTEQLLQDPGKASQALPVAMKLLKTERGLNAERLAVILSRFLETEKQADVEKLLVLFKVYSKHPDVLQNCWIALSELPEQTTGEKLEKILAIMTALPITTWDNCPLLVPNESFSFDYAKVRKALNISWGRVMRQPLTATTRKQMLTLLLENLLMHIEKPILLTDFLMDSLDVGGPISLMALQGVFTLIQEHNITYPDIYTKMYSLFQPDIFHTKYKARLFYLTDLFLSSTHLPEALVGAYVKRVARLALGAPPQDIIISLQFISNLLIRHKGLKRLLNDPAMPQATHLKDPYDMLEKDPVKSSALASSLWEVEALTQHVLPSVSLVAKTVLKANVRTEYDLGQVLELTESDLYQKASSADHKSYHLIVSAASNPMESPVVVVDTVWALY